MPKLLLIYWHSNIEMGSFEGKSLHVMRLACTNKKVIYVLAKIWVLLSNFQAHNTCRNRRIFWITCSLIQAVMNTNVLRNTSRRASMTSVVEIWELGVDILLFQPTKIYLFWFNIRGVLIHLTFQVNFSMSINHLKLPENIFFHYYFKLSIWWESFLLSTFF